MSQKKTARSKSGKTYKRSPSSKTGWVQVKAYVRSKRTRRATADEQEVNSCAHTRKARTRNRKPIGKKQRKPKK